MATAADVITKAMRVYGIIDQKETPDATDITNNAAILNDILRSEHVDGAAQYLMFRVQATVPAGRAGSISSFTIGIANAAYLVQVDAVAMKSLWCGDVGVTVNRRTYAAPTDDIVRTTNTGRIVRWHQERQADGSVLVMVAQPPATATPVLIEYGGRIPAISAGTDTVALPPEGQHDAAMLLGRRIFSSYGRAAAAVSVQLADSERIHMRWTDWAKGQQWLRTVRA